MPSNSETILTTQTHPADSTTQTVTGDNYKGDGYYSRSDGIHTVQYSYTDLQGTITIQGTLATTQQKVTGLMYTHIQKLVLLAVKLQTLQVIMYG